MPILETPEQIASMVIEAKQGDEFRDHPLLFVAWNICWHLARISGTLHRMHEIQRARRD